MRGNLNLRGQQPGGYGTMMRIGFCGYVCAAASGAAVAHSTIASTTTPARPFLTPQRGLGPSRLFPVLADKLQRLFGADVGIGRGEMV